MSGIRVGAPAPQGEMESVFIGIAPRLFTEHQSPQNVFSWALREKYQGEVGMLEQQVTANSWLKPLWQLSEHNHICREFTGADEQIERVFAHRNNLEFVIFFDNLGQHFRPFRPDRSQKNPYHYGHHLVCQFPSMNPLTFPWLIRGCDSVNCWCYWQAASVLGAHMMCGSDKMREPQKPTLSLGSHRGQRC